MENINQNNLLQKYIVDVLDVFDEELAEYLSVSQIGKVITNILGTEKNVTGQMINQVLVKKRLQKAIEEDDEGFKFMPSEKFKNYKKVVNEEENYGIIMWHFSVITVILDLDFNKSLKVNINRVLKRIEKYGMIFSFYDIDEDVLKKALEKIGIK